MKEETQKNFKQALQDIGFAVINQRIWKARETTEIQNAETLNSILIKIHADEQKVAQDKALEAQRLAKENALKPVVKEAEKKIASAK